MKIYTIQNLLFWVPENSAAGVHSASDPSDDSASTLIILLAGVFLFLSINSGGVAAIPMDKQETKNETKTMKLYLNQVTPRENS